LHTSSAKSKQLVCIIAIVSQEICLQESACDFPAGLPHGRQVSLTGLPLGHRSTTSKENVLGLTGTGVGAGEPGEGASVGEGVGTWCGHIKAM
jgi:hypothetical protein